jgi:hypothetical protein
LRHQPAAPGSEVILLSGVECDRVGGRAIELGVALLPRSQGFDQSARQQIRGTAIDGQPDALLVIDINAIEPIALDQRASGASVDAQLLQCGACLRYRPMQIHAARPQSENGLRIAEPWPEADHVDGRAVVEPKRRAVVEDDLGTPVCISPDAVALRYGQVVEGAFCRAYGSALDRDGTLEMSQTSRNLAFSRGLGEGGTG